MRTTEAAAAARAHEICVRLLEQGIAEGAAPHSIALRQRCVERAAALLGANVVRRRQAEPATEPAVTVADHGEPEASDMPVQDDDGFSLLRRHWAEPRPVPADRPSHADVLVRGTPITKAPDGEAVWVAVPDCTGVFLARRDGKGLWLAEDAGDLWPCKPTRWLPRGRVPSPAPVPPVIADVRYTHAVLRAAGAEAPEDGWADLVFEVPDLMSYEGRIKHHEPDWVIWTASGGGVTGKFRLPRRCTAAEVAAAFARHTQSPWKPTREVDPSLTQRAVAALAQAPSPAPTAAVPRGGAILQGGASAAALDGPREIRSVPVVYSPEEVTARAGYKRSTVEMRMRITGWDRADLLGRLSEAKRAKAERGELVFLDATTATDGHFAFSRFIGSPETVFLGTPLKHPDG